MYEESNRILYLLKVDLFTTPLFAEFHCVKSRALDVKTVVLHN